MEFIRSRNCVLPAGAPEMESAVRYHLWVKQWWPYRLLEPEDRLYWYETPSQSIVWKTQVAGLDRFEFFSLDHLAGRLQAAFPSFDPAEPYPGGRPPRGYCLAYQVRVVTRLDLPKPPGFNFPRLGWLPGDAPAARAWLATQPAPG
jgi:hypothetical protein